MITGLRKNNEGYYFVSENKIKYTLLEGMTIGGNTRYTSDTMIIFLDTYGNISDEATEKFTKIFGNMRFFVDYIQMGGEPNESDIEKIVTDFEKNHEDMIDYIIKERMKEMVKENGMIMMSEQEYREMKMRISELESDLDIAKMELCTYRSSIRKLANDNLSLGNVKEKSYGIEIPAGDFSDLIDTATLDWMEDSNGNMDEEKLEKLEETDLWFVWNGFCARIPYGCEICNEVLPAIKEAYDEYNS